jgi:hypothetical protein
MKNLEAILKYLGLGMALIYIVAGVTILFRPQKLFNIPEAYVVPIGIALLGYGLFRSYRLYQKYHKQL